MFAKCVCKDEASSYKEGEERGEVTESSKEDKRTRSFIWSRTGLDWGVLSFQATISKSLRLVMGPDGGGGRSGGVDFR